MSGNNRFLLDTNAVVSLLAGNRKLAALLDDADYVGISVISYLEFLAFDGLSDNDRTCFASFCARIEIVALSHEENEMIDQILDLRKDYRLKLPDAIIGATALSRNALLVTNDSHFSGVTPLTVQSC
jgi:predicted nucleic acid-binding protein